jgi:hypothetical protein
MATFAEAKPPYTGEHRLVEWRRGVIKVPEAVYHSSAPGPLAYAKCACGWSVSEEDANPYAALEAHGLAAPY